MVDDYVIGWITEINCVRKENCEIKNERKRKKINKKSKNRRKRHTSTHHLTRNHLRICPTGKNKLNLKQNETQMK